MLWCGVHSPRWHQMRECPVPMKVMFYDPNTGTMSTKDPNAPEGEQEEEVAHAYGHGMALLSCCASSLLPHIRCLVEETSEVGTQLQCWPMRGPNPPTPILLQCNPTRLQCWGLMNGSLTVINIDQQ